MIMNQGIKETSNLSTLVKKVMKNTFLMHKNYTKSGLEQVYIKNN